MPVATITNKGQVTIPKKIRDAMNLHFGDKIEFVCEKEGIITVRPIKKSVDAVFGRLYEKDRRSLSTEEINEIVRKQVKKEHSGQGDESA